MKPLLFCIALVLVFSTAVQAKTQSHSSSRFPVKGYTCETELTYAAQKKTSDPLIVQSFMLRLSRDTDQWQWNCGRVGGIPPSNSYECNGEKKSNGRSEALTTDYTSSGESDMRRCIRFVEKIQ